MRAVLAHTGASLEPHDVWTAWTFDPLVVVVIAGLALAYRRGWREGSDTPVRRTAFWIGLGALVVALVSPVDAMSGVLVSAHMVQHVLLILAAAPLLAFSAPGAALLRGTPRSVRSGARSARRAVGLDADRLRHLRSPVGRWLLYVITLWVWHASVVYGLAVENAAVHAVEHATFLGAAFLVWSAVLGPARVRVARGLALLGVFTLGLQGIFLSVLLTFARAPFYAEYLTPPAAWGIDPLADQQLAGVLMWIPAGFVHTGVALFLVLSWLRELDAAEELRAVPQPSTAPVPSVRRRPFQSTCQPPP